MKDLDAGQLDLWILWRDGSHTKSKWVKTCGEDFDDGRQAKLSFFHHQTASKTHSSSSLSEEVLQEKRSSGLVFEAVASLTYTLYLFSRFPASLLFFSLTLASLGSCSHRVSYLRPLTFFPRQPKLRHHLGFLSFFFFSFSHFHIQSMLS